MNPLSGGAACRFLKRGQHAEWSAAIEVSRLGRRAADLLELEQILWSCSELEVDLGARALCEFTELVDKGGSLPAAAPVVQIPGFPTGAQRSDHSEDRCDPNPARDEDGVPCRLVKLKVIARSADQQFRAHPQCLMHVTGPATGLAVLVDRDDVFRPV